MIKHFDITVIGKVQGVYFRAFTQTQAQKLGLAGFVKNESNGNVYIEAEGEEDQLNKLLEWCKIGPPNAEVNDLKVQESELKFFSDFVIKKIIW